MPNVLKSKAHETMKFGQLMESNVRNIFQEKSCIKGGRETSPRPFSKKSKLRISLDELSEILPTLFLLYAQLEDYQNILKLRC